MLEKVNNPLSLGKVKNHRLKYRATRRLAALKKMSALVLAWVCKIVCNNTPVLIARHSGQFSLRNSTKSFAIAAAMPIVTVPIQDVQLLDYAVAHETVNATYGMTASADEDSYLGLMDKDPYTSDQQRERDRYELDDENWNEVVFEDVYGGSTAKLALHTDWINEKGYHLDAVVNLDLPEQGISGPFRITSIKHILPQKKPADDDETDDYAYRQVTALFTHQSDQVYTIAFDNGESLGVTYQHPIYSTTAGDWVLAGELEIGDEVLTKSGITTVISSTQKDGSETVYNLEVKDLHNFLVGESGVVVHNACSREEIIEYLDNAPDLSKLPDGPQKSALEKLKAWKNGSDADRDLYEKFLKDFSDDVPLHLGEGGLKAWERLINAPDGIRLNLDILDDVSTWPASWQIRQGTVNGTIEVLDGVGTPLARIFPDRVVASGRSVIGQPGNKILNRVPPIKNMIYEVDGINYITDNLGRVTRTSGDLDDAVRVRLGNQQIRAVDVKDGVRGTDQGGHIIGARFFGAGEQINYYPQSANLNQGAWKTMENRWADEMVAGKDVKVEVNAIFNGSTGRPDAFEVNYWIDNVKSTEFFDNL